MPLQEYGYHQINSSEAVASPVGQHLPGIMDFQQVGARQFPVERKWALGLQVCGLSSKSLYIYLI